MPPLPPVTGETGECVEKPVLPKCSSEVAGKISHRVKFQEMVGNTIFVICNRSYLSRILVTQGCLYRLTEHLSMYTYIVGTRLSKCSHRIVGAL